MLFIGTISVKLTKCDLYLKFDFQSIFRSFQTATCWLYIWNTGRHTGPQCHISINYTGNCTVTDSIIIYISLFEILADIQGRSAISQTIIQVWSLSYVAFDRGMCEVSFSSMITWVKFDLIWFWLFAAVCLP